MNKSRRILLIAAVSSLLLLLFIKPPESPRSVLPPHATVLAFGDSLTYGTGVKADLSYPAALERSSGLKVLNAGIPGELSSEGLKRLGGLLQRYKPQLVILCHGGNDILMRKSRDQLRQNLEKMIKMSRDAGAQVLLVGVPDFHTLGFGVVDLYEEAADETGVMYEGDILSDIVTDNRLKSDRIHPNAEGYKMMAEAFLEVLRENGVVD